MKRDNTKRGISLRTFRKRYPMRQKMPDGTWEPTKHAIFLKEIVAAKTESERNKASNKYLYGSPDKL